MYANDDLNALLDGELGPVEAKKLREALVEDTALAERLEQLAFADTIIKTTYQAIDSEPLPQSVIKLLADNVAEESNVLVLKRPSWSSRPVQIAAAMILGLGAIMGSSLLRQATPDVYVYATTVGPIDKHSGLNSILSDNTSSVSHQLGNGDIGPESAVAIMPVLSFKSTMGDWCREYTVTSYTKSARTLACMQGEQWQIVLTSIEQSSSQPNEYATASTVTSASFDARVDSLIVGEPLSANQEKKLINDNWEKTK